jgi:hypothetical protein
VQLGHVDNRCVNPKAGHRDFIVIDTNGIHEVNVYFCDCEHRVSHRQQLLRCDWFPATVHHPQTCATARILDLFHILTLSGKLCGHNFYASLERLTDNTGLRVPKVIFSRFTGLLLIVR